VSRQGHPITHPRRVWICARCVVPVVVKVSIIVTLFSENITVACKSTMLCEEAWMSRFAAFSVLFWLTKLLCLKLNVCTKQTSSCLTADSHLGQDAPRRRRGSKRYAPCSYSTSKTSGSSWRSLGFSALQRGLLGEFIPLREEKQASSENTRTVDQLLHYMYTELTY
jgi:hypothetical protein